MATAAGSQEVSLEEVALTHRVRESWDQELKRIPARRGQPVCFFPCSWPVPELSWGSCLSAGQQVNLTLQPETILVKGTLAEGRPCAPGVRQPRSKC